MIIEEFKQISSRALKGYEGVESVRVTAIEPSEVGPVVRWEAPLLSPLRGCRERRGIVSIGPVPGPVVLNVLTRTLAARWLDGAPSCRIDWGEHLIQKHPQVFGAYIPSTGPGWSWLWQAGAEAVENPCLPKGFTTTDMKEKYGSIRWYHHADQDCHRVDDIIDAVEALSFFICEDCGRPGEIRSGSWLRCLCAMHAKGRKPR